MNARGERIAARILAKELYKNIATDEGVSSRYVSKIAIEMGLRRRTLRIKGEAQYVCAYLFKADIKYLREQFGRGWTDHLRRAVHDYVERMHYGEGINRPRTDNATRNSESLSSH